MNRKINILIVDDHRMFREGIKSRLEQEPDIRVVGDAGTAEEALALAQKLEISIALLDIRLPKTSGIELARLLRSRHPNLKILILSGYDFDQYVRAAAHIGIQGYILKDAPQESLIQAIRDIESGGAVLPPDIASKVMRSYANQHQVEPVRQVWELTTREIEILELLQQGLRNNEIGQHLAISPRTVEAHVGNIIAKLGVETRVQAVRMAEERNILKK